MPVDPSPDDSFVALEQVAQSLALTTGDVLDLINEGRLRGAMIGSPARWRVDRDSVDAYIEDRTEDARRAALWRQSQAASFPELWGRGEIRHDD